MSTEEGETLSDLIARHTAVVGETETRLTPASNAIVEASEKIAGVYGELLSKGYDTDALGRAALGAVVSLYDNMDLIFVLPQILRAVADRIETELPDRH